MDAEQCALNPPPPSLPLEALHLRRALSFRGRHARRAALSDHLFKLLLCGDSGVGKSSLLLRFTADQFEELSPTIGVDFKLKMMTVMDKRLKLTVWDTAGQERFRTLTSSYYRGAQGIIFTYDVTRRETFTNLSEIWLREVDLYSTVEDCVKMVVANKIDKESDRQVTREEGVAFARTHGCLFVETSAKTRMGVMQAFEELVQKILETPSLLDDGVGSKGLKVDLNGSEGVMGNCACVI